jgi:NADH-quinone oxidoreductase subunit G
VTLPVALAELPDGVVWLPGNSTGSRLRSTLGAGHGDVVAVSAAQSTAGGTQ